MRIVRELKDGSGKLFEVVVYVRETGDIFEKAVLQLANRALSSKKNTTTDAFGIIDVVVQPKLKGTP